MVYESNWANGAASRHALMWHHRLQSEDFRALKEQLWQELAKKTLSHYNNSVRGAASHNVVDAVMYEDTVVCKQGGGFSPDICGPD